MRAPQRETIGLVADSRLQDCKKEIKKKEAPPTGAPVAGGDKGKVKVSPLPVVNVPQTGSALSIGKTTISS